MRTLYCICVNDNVTCVSADIWHT